MDGYREIVVDCYNIEEDRASFAISLECERAEPCHGKRAKHERIIYHLDHGVPE
jgi:hypothetical protein